MDVETAQGPFRVVGQCVDPARLVAPWLNELACWAGYRRDGARPLAECVVRVAAPELTGDQLVSQTELAAIGGIAASRQRVI